MFWGVRNPDVTFILGGGKCRGHTRTANYCFGRLNSLLRGAFMLFPLPTRSTLESKRLSKPIFLFFFFSHTVGVCQTFAEGGEGGEKKVTAKIAAKSFLCCVGVREKGERARKTRTELSRFPFWGEWEMGGNLLKKTQKNKEEDIRCSAQAG